MATLSLSVFSVERSSLTTSLFVVLGGFLLLICLGCFTPQLRFIWHCFLAPLGANDQKTRLDKVIMDVLRLWLQAELVISSIMVKQRSTTPPVMDYYVDAIRC